MLRLYSKHNTPGTATASEVGARTSSGRNCSFRVLASQWFLRRLVVITRTAIRTAAAVALAFAAPALAQDLELPRQTIELVAPPFVHPHAQTTPDGPRIMEFRLTTEEKQIVIDDEGTKLQAMTFNGSIPGPMMVVHQGDYVEVTLVNPAT